MNHISQQKLNHLLTVQNKALGGVSAKTTRRLQQIAAGCFCGQVLIFDEDVVPDFGQFAGTAKLRTRFFLIVF